MTNFYTPSYTLGVIPTDPIDPDKQTFDTIQQMRSIVRRSVNDPQLIELVKQILKGTNLMDEIEVACKIFAWIKSNIRFVEDSVLSNQYLGANRDPYGEDFLITPVRLVTVDRKGDCDDFSMLAATMLDSIGIECKFVTIAADPRNPNIFSHVYVIANVNHSWIGFDTSHGKVPGWEYNKATRYQTWNI